MRAPAGRARRSEAVEEVLVLGQPVADGEAGVVEADVLVQLLARVKEDGVKQSLAEEAANIKAATEKENADLDEAKTQLEDFLNRIVATIQREKKEAEQDPQTVIIY